MDRYKSSAELKALAKEHMFGRYGTAIAAFLIAGFISGFVAIFSTFFLDSRTLSGVILDYLISFVIAVLTGLFSSGTGYFYLKISCSQPVSVGDIFYGFRFLPNKAVLLQFYVTMFIYLAMLPMTALSFIIFTRPEQTILLLPYSLALLLYGIVSLMLSLIYSQMFFLLHDFPNYSVKELLITSRKLMKGNKGRYFYLMVSFLPLILLSLLSCGFAFLWLIPYINATYAEFYLDLIQHTQTTKSDPMV